MKKLSDRLLDTIRCRDPWSRRTFRTSVSGDNTHLLESQGAVSVPSPWQGLLFVLFCKEQPLWLLHFCNCQSQFCAESKLPFLGRKVGNSFICTYDFLYITLFWAWSKNIQLWLSFLPCGYGAADEQTAELSLQSFLWSFTIRLRCWFFDVGSWILQADWAGEIWGYF